MNKQLIYSFVAIICFSFIGCDDDDSGLNSKVTNPHGKIYITNQADGTVSIFNSADLSLIKTFNTPVNEPHFVEFTHDNIYYFVLGREVGGTIAKYQTSNDSLIAQITVEGSVFPTSFAVSPNNDTMYVTDFTNDAGHIHRYDISGTNFTWLDSTLQAGRQTHDIRLSENGKLIISAGYSSDDITIINIENGDLTPMSIIDGQQVFNPASNSYGGYGVLIDKTSSLAYISCRKSVNSTTSQPQDQIRIMDLRNSTVLDSILLIGETTNDTEPIYMAISPDNNILYVANNRDNSLSVIQISTREVIANVPFGTPKAFGIDISSDGSRVYVGCTNTRPENGYLYMIETENYTKVDSVMCGSEPFGVSWIE